MGRYNHAGVWKALGSTLHFQDALSGALFLPVLPALVVQQLGAGESGAGESSATPAFSTAWVLAVMVACYCVGRSGTLGIARRLCSSGSSPRGPAVVPPSLVQIGALLVLSAAAYVACGILIERQQQHQQHQRTSRLYLLLYFGLFRSLAGCLAAGHRWSACRCLDYAGLLDSVPLAGESRHESAGAIAGLVAGYAVAGALYVYSGPSRLTPVLCLAAAAAHAPAFVCLLHVARKRCSSSGGGGSGNGGAIDGGYFTVRGTPGGSDAEFELMGHPPWSARDDSFDGVKVADGTDTVAPAAGAATRGGEDVVIPARYLRGCGDAVEAERRWRLTLDWRAKERIDEVRPVACYYYAIPIGYHMDKTHHLSRTRQRRVVQLFVRRTYAIVGQTEPVARKLLLVFFFSQSDDDDDDRARDDLASVTA